MPARQELQAVIDQLDEPQAARVLRLVKSALNLPVLRPWSDVIGKGHGPRDLSANSDHYLADGFGR